MTELVGEIRNSIQYFASLPGRAPISRVLLTGGGSRVTGLVETLQSQVRIPVQVVSALSRLDLRKLDQKPEQLATIDPVAHDSDRAWPCPNRTPRCRNST